MNELAMQTDVKVVDAGDVDTAEVSSGPSLRARYFGLTDRGKVRRNNEDQFLAADLDKSLRVQHTSVPQAKVQHSSDRGYLFVVADGMGGHAGGEQASALAIDSVEKFVLESCPWFARPSGHNDNVVFADFRQALGWANGRVLAESSENPELHGMGTTLTLAFCLNGELFVAHAGDCRCYLLRDGRLYRLTEDHTMAADMVRQGMLSPDEAAVSRWSHVVTSAVGAETSEVKVELHKLGLRPGDVLMLCSDGLTGMVGDEEIAGVLSEEADPEAACRRLGERANAAGGRDNISVIVARFVEG
jgi:protein phosphatase